MYLRTSFKTNNHLCQSLVCVCVCNPQRRPNAAARLAALPLVALVQTRLSVVCSHPSLRSVCEGLESGVIALLSPVVGKLEPHSEYDPRTILQ